MTKSIIHKFHVSGMVDSACVTDVRNSLSRIPGVRAVNVDIRKMEAEITASRSIGLAVLRNALGNTDFIPSNLTINVILDPVAIRDDGIEEV